MGADGHQRRSGVQEEAYRAGCRVADDAERQRVRPEEPAGGQAGAGAKHSRQAVHELGHLVGLGEAVATIDKRGRAQLRFSRCASFVLALNTAFIVLSAADPSGGIIPIWRAYCS